MKIIAGNSQECYERVILYIFTELHQIDVHLYVLFNIDLYMVWIFEHAYFRKILIKELLCETKPFIHTNSIFISDVSFNAGTTCLAISCAHSIISIENMIASSVEAGGGATCDICFVFRAFFRDLPCILFHAGSKRE